MDEIELLRRRASQLLMLAEHATDPGSRESLAALAKEFRDEADRLQQAPKSEATGS